MNMALQILITQLLLLLSKELFSATYLDFQYPQDIPHYVYHNEACFNIIVKMTKCRLKMI
jgi:hypothetical protein